MSGPKPQPRAEAFEQRHIPEPNSGCWLWVGAANRDGYGLFCGSRKGKAQHLAHRISWELFRGPIPQGVEVCHRCDVRCCVNPDHLFLATHTDNMADMYRKGRGRPGVVFGDANGSRTRPDRRPRGENHWTRRHKMEALNG